MATLEEPFLLSASNFDASTSKHTNGPPGFAVGIKSVLDIKVHFGEDLKKKQVRKGDARRSVAITTVQGNGVHLTDVGCVCLPGRCLIDSFFQLSDQTPLSSFTVSPSTIFTSTAVSVSYLATKDALNFNEGVASSSIPASSLERTRKTFVGVEREGASGTTYEVWCWTEQEKKDGTGEGEAVKTVRNVVFIGRKSDRTHTNQF